MPAYFSNSQRGELGGEPNSGKACRVIYASWHPDQLTLSLTWVRQFKDSVESFDEDEYGVPLKSLIEDEPGRAGDSNVAAREEIDTARLGEVTDFIAVMTSAYFAALKKRKTSELSWIIQSIEARERECVVWIAAMEDKMNLPRLRIGEMHFSEFPAWHPTKEKLMDPYSFFGRDDLEGRQRFASELNDAVNRLRTHHHACGICKSQRSVPGKR